MHMKIFELSARLGAVALRIAEPQVSYQAGEPLVAHKDGQISIVCRSHDSVVPSVLAGFVAARALSPSC